MNSNEIIEFLSIAEKLKCELRHSWTSSNRQESVAEHSWRLCLFSFILKDELPDYDMNKVMKMCLFHDIGEAISGDIPSFNKNSNDVLIEEESIKEVIDKLDNGLKMELQDIFSEIKNLSSKEAKLFDALDKLEAVIQHNEAPLNTWIPLEHELNKTYGNEEVKGIKILEELRETMREDTIRKLSAIK